ncbi:VWA domain-containing protein [Desulfobacterales bacterium HSG2]|nr:VWA domain-containing protein [Desulfobacterales bacterium HSG2]
MNPVIPSEYIILFSFILLLAGGAACWYSTDRSPPNTRLLLMFFRITAILLLTLIALNPGRWRQVRDVTTASWCVLLDSSQSMDVMDKGEKKTRWQRACETARNLRALSDKNQRIDFYTFSEIPAPADDIASLLSDKKSRGNGKSSEILGAIDMVLNQYSLSENVKGIFLLSDGRQIPPKEETSQAMRALARSAPIYAVCYGRELERKDIDLRQARRQQIAFSGQTVQLRAPPEIFFRLSQLRIFFLQAFQNIP